MHAIDANANYSFVVKGTTPARDGCFFVLNLDQPFHPERKTKYNRPQDTDEHSISLL